LPSHTEASALPGTSPSPVIPEAAPEQNPVQFRKSDMRYLFAFNPAIF
jgi:hypothetical protein